jgi:hypothetical protein
VRGGSLVRVDQCDLEVILAIALDGEGAPNRQVDDGGRRLAGIDLAVDQQPSLCYRDWRRVKRHRDRDVGIVGHDAGFLAGERNRSRCKVGVALITAVLAPPQHPNDRRAHGDQERGGSQCDRTNPFGR